MVTVPATAVRQQVLPCRLCGAQAGCTMCRSRTSKTTQKTQRQRRLVAGEGSAGVPPATAGGGDDDENETAGDAGDAKKGVAPDEASFARLGERALMDDRFDEFSVDLTRIRGKQKGAGAGRNEGKRRGKR